MRRPIAIGVDVGTSSVKALALATDGALVASASREISFDTPHPGWAETDPRVWWRATCETIRELRQHPLVADAPIEAVGLTGQMHGLVLVDREAEPVRPAIMWNDQRTSDEVAALERELTPQAILAMTGNRMLAGFTAPKWRWLLRHEPDATRRAHRILLPKDFVRLKLTGSAHSDVSDASGTLFFDCSRRGWSAPMCRAIGLDESLLPEVFESAQTTSRVSAAGALATLLPEGTPVVAGAGDQAAQAIGTGVVAEGLLSCTIGTSGVVFAATSVWRPSHDGSLHAFCHAVPRRWHLMGVTLSAGGSLRWMRDTLCGDLVARAHERGVDPYELMIAEAMAAPPGSDGVSFIPYLSGERTPRVVDHAAGAFTGLSTSTTRAHLIRAVLEGVACSLAETVAAVRACGVTAESIRLSGGGARSANWRQMLTDAMSCPTQTVETHEGAAHGAALLALVGAGRFPTVDAAAATLRGGPITQPSVSAQQWIAIADRYARAADAIAT
jgi:xylulokinase